MKIIRILAPFLFLAVGIAIAAILISSKREIEPTPPEDRPVPVEVITPQYVDHRFEIESHGTVQSIKSIALSAQVQGRIDWVSPKLEQGRQFLKGEELVRIDPRDFQLIIKKAEASISQSQAALLIEESQAQIAKSDWAELGGDKKASPLVLREPQLSEAKARLEAARADLQQAELNLSRCVIVAPFSGVVEKKLVDAGQFIRPGEGLAQIYGSDAYEIRIPIPLDDLQYLPLQIGRLPSAEEINQIDVRLLGNIGMTQNEWKAEVVSMEAAIVPTTRMATLIVNYQAPLDSSQTVPLPKGLFVRTVIKGLSEPKVLVLPRLALRQDDQIYVVDAAGQLQIRPAEVLQSTINDVIIKSNLEDGDSIVVSVLGVFVPGQSASIISRDGSGQ